jgi:benzoyl-CoA reductase subunit D
MEALREEVAKQLPGAEVATHRDALFAGALGAALWGAFRHHRIATRQGRTQDAAA